MLPALEQTKMSCHDEQAQVIAHGLSSEAAILFFDALPAIDVLMPPLAMTAIEELLHSSCSQRMATGLPCASSSTQAAGTSGASPSRGAS